MKRDGNGKPVKRLVIVDDDPAVRESLSLGLNGAFDIVATCASGDEALATLIRLPVRHLPHVVLLDIKMPGMGGIECCRELRKAFPKLMIAMHTAKSVREGLEASRVAGADAYLVKGSLPPAQLAATLLQLQRIDGQCLCVAGADRCMETNRSNELTQREADVMDFISQGWGYKQAADQFACTESNIKKTMARAIRHLRARSKDHAIRLWLEDARRVQKDTFTLCGDQGRKLSNS